jgi:hypothetical protein
MATPDEHVCVSPTPIVCAHKTLAETRASLKEARAALAAQGELNCVLVSQNCRIITRNTALEGTIYDLTQHVREGSWARLGGSGDPLDMDLCERSEQVARGLCDLRPSEQLK